MRVSRASGTIIPMPDVDTTGRRDEPGPRDTPKEAVMEHTFQPVAADDERVLRLLGMASSE